ncbi:MAG: acetolactate decarboxylase [Gammaproteobacteria bacterium]|nr:acetolactate decarboxylase [Gammaproteobacteria bacterium]
MSTLYQYSHFLAISHGLYDGTISVQNLMQYGNFGLGTFHALEGELVVIDGQSYHCTQGVKTSIANVEDTLPWAAVGNFTENIKTANLQYIVDFKTLEDTLLKLMETTNYPFLFHIEGTFENIVIGSVLKQEKPYPKIKEIIDSGVTVETGKIKGQLVGFYAPEFMFPMKGKGFHLHCLEEKQRFGGHVLELTLKEGSVKFECVTEIKLELPQNEIYQKAQFSHYEQDEHVAVFNNKHNNGLIGLEELIKLYEVRLPYCRNHIEDESQFDQNLPKLLTLFKLFNENESLLVEVSDKAKQALVKLIKRTSEYMLSVKRNCDFVIRYNNWGLQLIKNYAIKDIVREQITLLNHLGFAYYFLNEIGKGNALSLTKARESLERALDLNRGKAHDLMAYAHCILGQVELFEKNDKKAYELFSKAYSFYRHKKDNDSFELKQALLDIQNDIDNLKKNLTQEERNDKYQAMVVLGYIADTKAMHQPHEFSEKCYLLCIAFIKIYWQHDTLQSADLYYRLAKLHQKSGHPKKALESYKNALNIYVEISGIDHPKVYELSQEIGVIP